MALSCSKTCLRTRSKSKARNVAQHSWESVPTLNAEQPGAVEDSEVALNDPGCVARAHPRAALSD